LHDYRGDGAATLAGASFLVAFLLLNRCAQTFLTEDLLIAAGISLVLMFSTAALISRVAHVNHFHTLSFVETIPIFLGAGLTGNLATRFPRLRSSFILRKASMILSSAAAGSGIGFLEGVVIDPGFGPSMLQDGAALVGALAGATLGGGLLASGLLYFPKEAAGWALSSSASSVWV
jgi:hypothetical protein